MSKWALRAGALVSLAAALAVAATWVTSWRVKPVRQFDWFGERWEYTVADGRIGFTDLPQVAADKKAYQEAHNAEKALIVQSQFAEVKRRLDAQRATVDVLGRKVRAPVRHTYHLIPLLLWSLLPAAAWAAARAWGLRTHRVRSLAGHCRSCGYDLHATPYCCPECGKPVSTWAV